MEFSRPEYWSGSCSLLHGIFPTQGSNPGLPYFRWILYHMSHQGSPCGGPDSPSERHPDATLPSAVICMMMNFSALDGAVGKKKTYIQYGRVCNLEVHVSGLFFMGSGFILSRSVPVSPAELLSGSVGTTFHRL